MNRTVRGRSEGNRRIDSAAAADGFRDSTPPILDYWLVREHDPGNRVGQFVRHQFPGRGTAGFIAVLIRH